MAGEDARGLAVLEVGLDILFTAGVPRQRLDCDVVPEPLVGGKPPHEPTTANPGALTRRTTAGTPPGARQETTIAPNQVS